MKVVGLICFAALSLLQSTRADVVKIAVASNFRGAMTEIAHVFENDSTHQLLITYGASGKLYAQIVNGAPFDVFLSADQIKPQRLIESSLAQADSRVTYAYGRLVLWSRQKTNRPIREALLTADGRIAIANPRLAPYGVASMETLNALSVADETRARWVLGENIAQTFHFVHSGNAALGFVANSQLNDVAQMNGTTWRVAPYLHAPIAQDAVLLTRASKSKAARAFIEALQTRKIRKVIEQHGYDGHDVSRPANGI